MPSSIPTIFGIIILGTSLALIGCELEIKAKKTEREQAIEDFTKIIENVYCNKKILK